MHLNSQPNSLMDLEQINIKESRFYMDRDFFSEIHYDNYAVGEMLRTTYNHHRDELEREEIPPEDDRNYAKVAVLWRSEDKWKRKLYPQQFVSGWMNDFGTGKAISSSFLPKNPRKVEARVVSQALKALQKDFEERGVEMNATQNLKWAEAYTHAEQSWMSCVSAEGKCANKNDNPEVVILQFVSLDPLCDTCRKTFKKLQSNQRIQKKFLKKLFPSLTGRNPPLRIFYHTLSEYFNLKGIDLEVEDGPKLIEDIFPRSVFFGEDGLEDFEDN